MKKIYSQKTLIILLVLSILATSCKKESASTYDIFKGLKIDFKTALPADEVYVEFSLSKASSGANMGKVVLTEVGSTTPVLTQTISYTDRYSYTSGVQILKASNPSTVAYKITVYDDQSNDITSSVTVNYPAGKLIVSDATLITDKEVKTFPEGKSVYIDYTITSKDANIKSVWLESYATGATEPTRITIATVSDNAVDKRSYRGAVRLGLNRDGGAKYRIYATDEANDYIGDGYTSLNTNVEAGFELAANKFVYAPDFAAKVDSLDLVSACFYSIKNKKTYTYTEAKENSADIDFGIILTGIGNSPVPSSLNFYSISLGPNIKSIIKYDISTWATKKSIRFSAGIGEYTNPSPELPTPSASFFLNRLSSGLAIKNLVGKGPTSINRTTVTTSPGNMFFFLTQEGKYGAVFVNGFGKDYKGRYYTNIDVKIEK